MSARIVDLSHPLNAAAPPYPGDAPLRLTPVREHERDGHTAFLLTTQLHTGTHIDFPMHMLPGGHGADAPPAHRFVGRGVLLDARGQRDIGMRPEYEGMVGAGDMVLLYTGHDSLYGREEYFTEHPVITAELADFFAARGVGLLGMDTPSPDRAPHELHKILLAAGVFLLENLTNLGALAGAGDFELIAPPLRIAAEASPVRALARINVNK